MKIMKLPKINFHLSWKQKSTMVIAITIVGLFIVAGSAFMGFNTVNSDFEKQNIAVGYKQNTQSIEKIPFSMIEAPIGELVSGPRNI